MSNFFNKTDLTRNDVEEIVSDTLKNCDDGEYNSFAIRKYKGISNAL